VKINETAREIAMDYVKGIDVSKWQGVMNWAKARSAGARFAFIRAGSISTGGACYTDYQFERNSSIAPDYMPVGYYFYFRPQFDARAQAGYFCNLIRDKRQSLPPVLDLENNGEPDMAPAAITDAAQTFLYEVYHRLTVWPILYSRAIWLNDNTITINIWKTTALWLARYKASLTAPWSDGYCKPRDWNDWEFWQYSAGGNGKGPEYGAQSKSIDLNYFNGDQAAFESYIGSPIPELIRITAPLAVSIRSGPEAPAVGATWRGSEWKVLGKSGDYYKVEGWLPANKVEEIRR
jgi:lysozyme